MDNKFKIGDKVIFTKDTISFFGKFIPSVIGGIGVNASWLELSENNK